VTVEIGGLGEFGWSYETTYGTFVPAANWIPIRSESLKTEEDRQYRMNLRGLADRQNPILSYTHVEGDVTFEVTRSAILPFLYAARMAPAKAGSDPDFVYTFTPANVVKPTTATGATTRKTLSIAVNRSGTQFQYAGCSVTGLNFSLDNGTLMCTASIFGLTEVTGSETAASFLTDQPYGPGKVTFNMAAPASSPRTDVDTVTININDNGGPENRIKAGRGPAFNRWGEREVTVSAEYDFDALTDYNAWIAATKFEVILNGEISDTNDEVTIKVNAAAHDDHDGPHLTNLGDLVRASVDMHGYYDTGNVYTITVKSNLDTT
jgi:hypothetical protein